MSKFYFVHSLPYTIKISINLQSQKLLACRMLMKLTPEFNFINILRVAFAPIYFCLCPTVIREKLCNALSKEKGLFKILMRLTLEVDFLPFFSRPTLAQWSFPSTRTRSFPSIHPRSSTSTDAIAYTNFRPICESSSRSYITVFFFGFQFLLLSLRVC